MRTDIVIYDIIQLYFYYENSMTRRGGAFMDDLKNLLIQFAKGLAAQFGNCCEIVIHDVTKGLDNTIVHIENGHVTHRETGGSGSKVVFEALNSDSALLHDRLSYLTRTDDGKVLKSSTLYIRRPDGSLAYIFSINYDISVLSAASDVLHTLLLTEGEQKQESREEEETTRITHSVSELLDTLIDEALARIGKPVAMMTKDDKVEVVRYLNDAGAFLITKSGDKVASLLGISKFTLYKYMDS